MSSRYSVCVVAISKVLTQMIVDAGTEQDAINQALERVQDDEERAISWAVYDGVYEQSLAVESCAPAPMSWPLTPGPCGEVV